MERKIGEIFEYNGEWYQCVRSILTCSACEIPRPCTKIRGLGYCSLNMRNDKEQVVFKKLEKVGKSYEHHGKLYQCYKLPMETEIRLLPNNCYPIGKDNLVEIEIKQNKEDMEEKKTNLVEAIDALCKRYNMSYGVRTDFMSDVKEIIKNKDKEDNLKPFDLEAAKAGNPVCTRDGRKARIICFDFRDVEEICCLIAAVDYGEAEKIYYYDSCGKYRGGDSSKYDLMMLPEKKDGWINVKKDASLFKSREEAERNCTKDYVPVRVEFEI